MTAKQPITIARCTPGRWKEKALSAEQIIKQLLVLLGYCLQKIGALTRQVTWLNKQQFGSKSEATRPAPEAEIQPASEGGADDAEQPPAQRKRKRGQQLGGKGPKRRRRLNLREEITHHHLSQEERTCPICHKIRPEIGLTEESEEIDDWEGLTVFVEHPHVPMDNNAAERALRTLAVARKNFYGSGSKWSGELALGCFTILATLRQHGICPRRYFRAYLEACARQGGKAPENLEEFLPWKWSPEKKAAWRTQEQAP